MTKSQAGGWRIKREVGDDCEPKMSSNGSYDYDYDVDLDVLPVGKQYDYEEEEVMRRRHKEELE